VTAKAAFHEAKSCRICGSSELRSVLDLGYQSLTGLFPRKVGAELTRGPLEMVKCFGGDGACGLVQLRHTYDPGEMYSSEYGYRSSLNRSMVEHLGATVESLLARSPIGAGDTVLDVGSNDGTTLSFYPENAQLIGIDPTAVKFAKYYKPHIKVVPDFFSSDAFFAASGGRGAKIVTSIAMFYDLERPIEFMRQVHAVLVDGGLWHCEQSYLPSMLAATAYDTICHEHTEYYSLAPIVWMADRVGFSIVDVKLNDVNGGSFAITAAKTTPGAAIHAPIVARIVREERDAGLSGLEPFAKFGTAVAAHRRDLRALLEK
jgi:NDP-4-keto-2,6-dideoxyhexose 3-C-methyltransferase